MPSKRAENARWQSATARWETLLDRNEELLMALSETRQQTARLWWLLEEENARTRAAAGHTLERHWRQGARDG